MFLVFGMHKLRVQAKFWVFAKIVFFQRSLKMLFWQRIRNLRKISCRSVPWVYSEVLSASSYGWTKVKLEFRSQCKVLFFGGIICIAARHVLHYLRAKAHYWTHYGLCKPVCKPMWPAGAGNILRRRHKIEAPIWVVSLTLRASQNYKTNGNCPQH